MVSVADFLNYNLNSDFTVLSDFIFTFEGQNYLGHPPGRMTAFEKEFYTDFDGVWEKSGSKPAYMLVPEKLALVNKKFEKRYEELMKVYQEVPTSLDLTVQEKRIAKIYDECGITFNDFDYACYLVSKDFTFVKNALPFVSSLRKAGYRLSVFSGCPTRALKYIWKKMDDSISIMGTDVYFDDQGRFNNRVELLLGSKKGLSIHKHLENNIRRGCYVIVLSDDPSPKFDACMVKAVMKTSIAVPIWVGEFGELPFDISTKCPDGREDAMNFLKPIYKFERGFVESLLKDEITMSELADVWNDIEKLMEKISEENYSDYKRVFVDLFDSFLKLESPLFPESMTKIRVDLARLNYSEKASFDLVKKIYKKMKKYSPDPRKLFRPLEIS